MVMPRASARTYVTGSLRSQASPQYSSVLLLMLAEEGKMGEQD